MKNIPYEDGSPSRTWEGEELDEGEVPKLKEQLRIAREGLKNVKLHQENCMKGMHWLGTTWRIAENTLKQMNEIGE